MNYTEDIVIDLNPNNAPPIIAAKQQDVDSRTLIFHYTKNGQPYNVNSNNSIAFRMRKPDKYMVFNDATINADGTVSVTLTQQCLTTAGRGYADLVEFSAEGKMLSTVSFVLNIMPSPEVMGSEAITSNEFLYLKSFIDAGNQEVAKSQEWVNGYHGETPLGPSINDFQPGSNNNAKYWSQQAQQLGAEQVTLAEAWAKGTKDGQSVTSSDAAYHNNAKYWSDQANLKGSQWNDIINNTYDNLIEDIATAENTIDNKIAAQEVAMDSHNAQIENLFSSIEFSLNTNTGILTMTYNDI